MSHRFGGSRSLVHQIHPRFGDLRSQSVQTRLPGSGEGLHPEQVFFDKPRGEQRSEFLDSREVRVADRRRMLGVQVAVAQMAPMKLGAIQYVVGSASEL